MRIDLSGSNKDSKIGDIVDSKNDCPTATKSSVQQNTKKQVSLSWILLLLIVIVPLIAVFSTITWYFLYKKDIAYITPESVIIRAEDDLTINWIANEGDKVKKGDTISVVYFFNKAKQAENALWLKSTTQEISSKPNSKLLYELSEIVQLYKNQIASNKARLAVINKESLNGLVTPYELQSVKNDYQQSLIMYKKASADYEAAKYPIVNVNKTNQVDAIDNFKKSLNMSIVSPIDGMIVKRIANNNERVYKGQSLLHIAGYEHFFVDMYMKADQISHIPLGSYCKIWLPNNQIIMTKLNTYIQSDSLGFVIGRMKPELPIDSKFMIPNLPVKARCK